MLTAEPTTSWVANPTKVIPLAKLELLDWVILKNGDVLSLLRDETFLSLDRIRSIYLHRNAVESLDELLSEVHKDKHISKERKSMYFQVASFDKKNSPFRQWEFLILAIYHYSRIENVTESTDTVFSRLIRLAKKYGNVGLEPFFESIIGKPWNIPKIGVVKIRALLKVEAIFN